MSDRLLNRFVALGVFLVSVAIYLETLSRTVVFWDVGEFCAASRLLQVPHPPGSPLFIFIARIASLIPFRDDIAARMHAVSAIGSALGIMFLYLVGVILIKKFRGPTETTVDRIIVFGSSAIGALTLAFSTTYWDNSIEAEVYGLGMFFVSICLWLALKWWYHADEPHNEKYILLIAYLLGLATGVHILVLLVTIPILMIIYFRKYEYSRKGFIKFLFIALAIFFVIYPGIVQFLPGLLDGDFKGFKNDLLPFVPPLIILAASYGVYRSYRARKKMPHIACLSFLFIVLGYTTYTQVIIRANVDNIPMNENDPSTLAHLTSYLTREQYGETPLLKGESWDNETQTFQEKVFPRRWSTEAMHEPTRVNYSSDGDFFWRYQVNHMFIRYLLWNFVGAEGDWQDAGVNWRETWGIPLFISLFGLYYIFKKDWKVGLSLLVMFIIMGIILDLYQNQQDPQPRERDYFYVGAYYAMCLWIMFGIVGIIDFLKNILKNGGMSKLVTGGVLVVSAVAVPVNLARINWKEHDRSQLYIAWDYSYNLLQSVDKNAILFTNGDNDTFPLWYLQDVEGVRRDVRIVNLSLLNTSWYIHELKISRPYRTKQIPITLTDQQIDRISATRWESRRMSIPVPRSVAERFGATDSTVLKTGMLTWTMKGMPLPNDTRYLRIQDIMVKDIITANRWERPIFFAATCSPDSKIGLDSCFSMEGVALRLRPIKSSSNVGGLNIPMMEKNFMAKNVVPSKEYQPGFLFRNLNRPDVYYDENEQRMMMNYRVGYMRIADYDMRVMNDKEKTREVLNYMENLMPISVIPMQDRTYTYYVAKVFDDLGEREHFDAYSKIVEAKCLDLIAKGQLESNDVSSNPYVVLAEIYGMRKDYSRAIDMLNTLSDQYPGTSWVKNQIEKYDKLRKGIPIPDSSKPQ
jgi:hypothetical protein